MRDDIPEAIRRSANPPAKSRIPVGLIAIGGLVVGAIALIAAALILWPKSEPAPQVVASVSPSPSAATPSATPSPVQSTAASPEASPDQVLGHLAYQEAPANAAAAAGVRLTSISGFRSVADQNDLFFKVKEQRNQAVSKRAEVSAPPGHSEHHTGYAVDIGDGDRTDTNLSQSFENTPAFQWLSEHAAQYSFEMSFTKGNTQGVSYEPWHWRFVGDRSSLETFYRAQHLKSENP
jgi:zinc D-Ala-D-Ala carboxypeptidase